MDLAMIIIGIISTIIGATAGVLIFAMIVAAKNEDDLYMKYRDDEED